MHRSKEEAGPDTTTMRVGIKEAAEVVAIDAIKTGVLTIRDAMTGAMARRTT